MPQGLFTPWDQASTGEKIGRGVLGAATLGLSEGADLLLRGMQSDFDPNAGPVAADLAALRQQAQRQALGLGGPSPAIQLLQQGTERAQGAALGIARASRGISPGLALRRALYAQDAAMGRGTQQIALLRSQEQLAAQDRAAQLAQWQLMLEKAVADGDAEAVRQLTGMILAAGGAAASYAAGLPKAA